MLTHPPIPLWHRPHGTHSHVSGGYARTAAAAHGALRHHGHCTIVAAQPLGFSRGAGATIAASFAKYGGHLPAGLIHQHPIAP